MTAGDVLTLAEIQELRRTSSLRGAALVLHAWAVIALSMAAYVLWPSALTLAVAIAVIGSRQLGLAILMHEAAHWLLFTSHRVTNGVARWLCAYPLFEDLPRYRRSHHLHHRHTRQADDPDLALSRAATRYPRRAVASAALRDLSGWTALTALLGWRPWHEPAAEWRRLRGPLAANAGLFALLAAAGHWPLFPLLWLLPMLTWYPALTRLRNLAEHAMVPDDDDPLLNSRTTAAGPDRPRALRALLGQLSPRASPARLRALLEAPARPRVCSSPRATAPGWSEAGELRRLCSGGPRAPIDGPVAIDGRVDALGEAGRCWRGDRRAGRGTGLRAQLSHHHMTGQRGEA